MNEIEDLNVSICDWSYQEGLSEIINNLKTVKLDTRAMNETTESRLVGQEEMLKKVIDYLEKCL